MHTRLGALPAIVHRAPTRVAIIGLGSGDTAWAAACRPQTRQVTVFELSGSQPDLLRRLVREQAPPDLTEFLRDPRVLIWIGDGRAALLHHQTRYDLIEADALWPDVAGSGNLYSVEFFSLCARRLERGGLMCTWGPTARVDESFRRAFPYVLATASRELLIGSNAPIEVDRAAWEARLDDPRVGAYLGREAVADVRRMVHRLREVTGPPRWAARVRPNRDLFPRDELRSP
jgi:hypothetical protein